MAEEAPENSVKWYSGLRTRIILLMSLVALPIGFIAVVQTNKLSDVADRNAELALLSLSEQVIQSERLVIQRALGVANILTKLVPVFEEDPSRCLPVLGGYLLEEPDFSFVGIIPASGVMTCSSVDRTIDFGEDEIWGDLLADPRKSVSLIPEGRASKTSVVNVSIPFRKGGEFGGFVSISIPTARLDEETVLSDLPVEGLVQLYSFNDDGELLLTQNSLASSNEFLPANLNRDWFAQDLAQSFTADAANGDPYIYTLVPVSESPLTVLGVWRATESSRAQFLPATLPASLFPVLMWLATVLVAVMGLYTMVLRHITRLRHQMSDFASSRRIPTDTFDGSAPSEIVDIQRRFKTMTEDILREEAQLEAMLREQKVLTKEIHHRVKNNLQMIASIMNMQIRKAEHDETVETLQRVQDRIGCLADVHTDLFLAQQEGRLNVGGLIERTLKNAIESGVPNLSTISLTQDIEDVWLYPDQVVALTLLVNETVTNAVKYIAPIANQKPELLVSLSRDEGTCTFTIRNSVHPGETPLGTGIGAKLIRTFAIKLEGTTAIETDSGYYAFSVSFPIAEFEHDVRDF